MSRAGSWSGAGAAGLRLRPYQDEAVRRSAACLQAAGSTLAVLATGLGKTVVFAHLARKYAAAGRRVLVLAHREELIAQAADKVHRVTGEPAGVEMGERFCDEGGAFAPSVVCSSVQTMSRARRRERFNPRDFGLVVIDEAHHATASSYREVVDHFRQGNPDVHVFGVTATPRRADEQALGQVFASVSYEMGIEAAVDSGWLVPVEQHAVVVEGLDFSRVRSAAGDLSEADLERVLAEEKVLHGQARPTVEVAAGRPTLVFCATVRHSRLFAEVLNRYLPDSALSLDGSSDPDARRRGVADFRERRRQFLCNCGLFLEGFDAPEAAVVAMARPTKSLPLYTQVLGRGTRPLDGVLEGLDAADPSARRAALARSRKPLMTALDFVGNSGRHKLVSAVDVLGGRYGEDVRRYARETAAAEGRPAPVADALERAAEELALLQESEAIRRRAAVTAEVDYRLRSVDPFGRPGDGPVAASPGPPAAGAEPATERQAWRLHRRHGWAMDAARRLTKRQASAVISKLEGEGAV